MRVASLLLPAFLAGAFALAPFAISQTQVTAAAGTSPSQMSPQQAHEHALATDFGQLARYQAANQALGSAATGEPRVIFYGDSITDGWHLDQYFPGKSYLNRGISGQTTTQMVVRFRQDVIDLQPRVVVVLAGTNDLSGNTGPMTVEQTEENYATMAELARLHGIGLVFSSIMPVNDTAHPEMTKGRPPATILALNTWLQSYCQANRLVYLDYFRAMVDPSGHLQQPLSYDGLHPNEAGYHVMAPLAQQAVTAALAQPAP